MAEPVPDERETQDLGKTVQLCLRAEAGEELAFDELYRRHYDRVCRSAAARMGRLVRRCQQDIEDVAQEVLAEAFKKLAGGGFENIKTVGAFRNYLSTVLVNRIRSRARAAKAQKRGHARQKLMRDCMDSSVSSLHLAADLPSPSRIVRAREIEERLEEAMLKLGERHRHVLDLVYNCGMTPAEIAEAQLLSGASKPESVRLILFRARERLRELAGPLLS